MQNGERVRVTCMGSVESFWFYNKDGEPQSRVNIGIKPLRDEDLRAYNRLCNTRSMPPGKLLTTLLRVAYISLNNIAVDTRYKLWASKLMTVRKRSEAAMQVRPCLFTTWHAYRHFLSGSSI